MRADLSSPLTALALLLAPAAGGAQDSLRTVADPMVLAWHRAAVMHIDFSADGQRIASSGGDSTVRVWLAQDGRELRRISGAPRCAAFLVGDGLAVAAVQDGQIDIWPDGATAPARSLLVEGHDAVYPECKAAVASDRASMLMTTIARDGAVFLEEWDLGTGARRRRVAMGFGENYALAVGSSADAVLVLRGTRSASGQAVDFFEEYDLPTGDYRSTDPDVMPLWPTSLAAQPAGRLVATTSQDHPGVLVWSDSIPSGEEEQMSSAAYWPIQELRVPEGVEVGAIPTAVQFSPDGQSLAVATSTGHVVEWAIDSWQPRRVFTGARGAVTILRYSPDGGRIAAGSSTGSVFVWVR